MSKFAVTAVAAGLLVAPAGTAAGAARLDGAPAAAQGARLKPSATVLFTPAVIIVGKHFKARERLRVTLVGSETYTRRVRSTATGSFRIDIGAIPLNACNAYTLKVVGALGSRVSSAHTAKPC